jgi:hypothetical protein
MVILFKMLQIVKLLQLLANKSYTKSKNITIHYFPKNKKPT